MPRKSVWRRRLIGLCVLFAVGLAIDPASLYSSEYTDTSDQIEANSPEMVALSETTGPYVLTNKSYAPGRKLLMGAEGQQLDDVVHVSVEDASGRLVVGVPVRFEILTRPKKSGAATISAEVATGPDGIARADLQLAADGSYLIAARTDDMTGDMPQIKAKALAPSWWVFLIFGLLGGLGLFLYGMELGAGGLQKVAGDKMRTVLGALTKNRVMGVIVGTFVTGLVQSSSATTVMVVGFVSAGLMTLVQALGVIMGANIGTTLTVQLIAFKITDYALLMIGIGFITTVATKRKMYTYIGEIILGFGLIFYGMAVMSVAMNPLRTMPVFSDTLLSLGDRPFLGILGAAVFTGLIQSSGATIGLAVVLAGEGLIDLRSAMPIVFGANIGTTVTTLLAMVGATNDGKRTGVAHLLFNIIGVVLFFPLLGWFVPAMVKLTQMMGSNSIPREVANGHMVFNVIVAVLFLPFLKPFAWLVERLLPSKEEEEGAFKAKYLNNDLLETPELALAAAWQEVLRLGEIAGDMVRRSVDVFGTDAEDAREWMRARAQEIDWLSNDLRGYYIRLSQKNLGLMQSREKQGHMSIVDDIRQFADYLGDEVVDRATNLAEQNADFSEQGRMELEEYRDFTVELHMRTMVAMRERDQEIADAVRQMKDDGEDHERRLRSSHLVRLDAGVSETIATSTAHMDLLSGFRQIGRHHFRICRMLNDFLKVPQRRTNPVEEPAESKEAA